MGGAASRARRAGKAAAQEAAGLIPQGQRKIEFGRVDARIVGFKLNIPRCCQFAGIALLHRQILIGQHYLEQR